MVDYLAIWCSRHCWIRLRAKVSETFFFTVAIQSPEFFLPNNDLTFYIKLKNSISSNPLICVISHSFQSWHLPPTFLDFNGFVYYNFGRFSCGFCGSRKGWGSFMAVSVIWSIFINLCREERLGLFVYNRSKKQLLESAKIKNQHHLEKETTFVEKKLGGNTTCLINTFHQFRYFTN